MGWAGSFCRNDRGTVALIFAILLPLVCMVVGGAVDFLRWSSAKSKTSAAIDAAVLAGARTLLVSGDGAEAVAIAQSYYQKNIADRILVDNDTVTFQVAEDGTSITGSGGADLRTSFLNIAGISTLPLVPQAESGFAIARIRGGGGSNLEVALMLDLTGSMCDDSYGPCTSGAKLDALKTAASDLVEIVVRDEQTPYTTRVALVPFSTQVRVAPNGAGAAMMRTLTDLDATWSGYLEECSDIISSGGSETSNWNCGAYTAVHYNALSVVPCVTDRHYDSPWVYDYTDDAPGAGKWLNAASGSRMGKSMDSSNTTPATGLGLTADDPMEWWNYNHNGVCYEVSEANEVVPLSSQKTVLKDKIQNLSAFGSTAGALATAWSWYTLSPKWASVFPAGSEPRPYSEVTQMQANGKPLVRKVAVIMSDGVYNTYRSWKNSDQQMVSDHAKQLCTNMKAEGIEIYTVGFALDQLSASERAIAEDTLRSCGTDVGHFYSTVTASELQGAFRDIAIQLSSIVLRN